MSTSAIDTAPAPQKAAFWEDFIDILTSPREVFERRREGPLGRALLVVLALFTAMQMAILPVMRPMFDAQRIEQAQKMREGGATAEQVAQAGAMQEKFMGVFAAIGTPIGVGAVLALTALALLVIGKLLDGEHGYKQSMIVATYAAVPGVLAFVVMGIIGLVRDPADLTTMQQYQLSPALLVGGGGSKVVQTLLGAINPFTIWSTIITGVGLSVVGRMTLRNAMIAAVIVAVIATVLQLLPALMAG